MERFLLAALLLVGLPVAAQTIRMGNATPPAPPHPGLEEEWASRYCWLNHRAYGWAHMERCAEVQKQLQEQRKKGLQFS